MSPWKFQKITPKMIIIWAVSFVLLLVIGFGTTATVLACMRVQYGKEIKYESVFSITYLNEKTAANASASLHNGKELIPARAESHKETVQEILALLKKGGKTNRLANLFRGNPDKITVESNAATEALYLSNFLSTYNKNAIIIDFHVPQFSVKKTDPNGFKYELQDGNGIEGAVWSILIPLDKSQNKFQQQTWYLFDKDPVTNFWQTAISYKLKTYGNYSKLWDLVNGLNVQP